MGWTVVQPEQKLSSHVRSERFSAPRASFVIPLHFRYTILADEAQFFPFIASSS